MATISSTILEVFDNPRVGRDYNIHIKIPEFTCLCPKTGQPDFATINLDYVPAHHCVELKALKLYISSFRQQGVFHEAITNQILDHVVAASKPNFMRIRAEFNVRGGIYTTVIAQYRKPNWQTPETIVLP